MSRSDTLNGSSVVASAVFAAILASTPAQALTTLKFDWEGQIAGFRVEGLFSYDEAAIPADRVIRKTELLSFDVSFYDPAGVLLRTYVNNHLSYPDFNFNFDTNTMAILQDGFFGGPNGIDIGEYTPDGAGGFTGLNFWSIPDRPVPPHVHFDDWGNEFGFPDGFSDHEDVGFFTLTTQDLLDTGRVGAAYVNNTNFGPDEFGQRMSISAVPLPSTMALLAGSVVAVWSMRRGLGNHRHRS